ncbi:MAG: hypothetical protein AB1599_10520, partial [Planctomycetota bacterium]
MLQKNPDTVIPGLGISYLRAAIITVLTLALITLVLLKLISPVNAAIVAVILIILVQGNNAEVFLVAFILAMIIRCFC